MHSLIERQIKRHLKDLGPFPAALQDFIRAVNNAYHENDEDRLMLERAFDLSSRELMQLNAELRESEEKYRLIAENTADLITVIDTDWRISYISPSILRTHGFTVEEAMGLPLDRTMTPASRQTLLNVLAEERELEATGKADPNRVRILEIEQYRKDGSVIWLESSLSAQRDRENKLIGILAVSRDITDRKRTEEALQENRQQLANIIEFLPDATLVIDREGKVIAWNRSIEALTGVKKKDIIGRGDYEYAIPFYGRRRPILIDYALKIDAAIEKQYTAVQRMGDILFGEAFTPELTPGNVHLSGTASVLRDNNGRITAAIECIRDNTERKKLEERLNRAEKMESLGTLAGGVAHDLNNVLGALVGYSELLAIDLPADTYLKRYAENILESSIKGAAIIQDLLTLARRNVSVSEVVDLNKIVADYLRTPEFENLKSHHPGLTVATDLEFELLKIKGSPVHLAKTIMNLVSNAAESMAGGGKITIRTENRYLDQPVRGYDDIREGDYAVLKVTDTGSGIAASDLDKIFEPFYTKKVMGRSGTGLGLAVVWGTLKDHRGYIDVLSREGRGSTFSLYFPVTRELPALSPAAVCSATYRGRGESILVVDDVKEQRELATSMLERLGYRVDSVAGGEEAVEYLKRRKTDLLVLDMVMEPGIDGYETYRRVVEIRPGQKAVLISGFSESELVHAAQGLGAGAYVKKPYILERLGLAVRQELNQPA